MPPRLRRHAQALTHVAALGLVACGSDGHGVYSGAPVSETGNSMPAVPGVSTAGDVLFDGKLTQAEHTAPVVGGTLLVTRDGQTIIAADPDRDAVFIVDSASQALSSVALQRMDEPGRVAEGPAGTVYVALRRAGALVAIDLASATVTRRVAVCGSPRGVAYDAKRGSLYVACRSGQLLTLDAADLSLQRTVQLDSDLRDVIVRDRDLIVTRFLQAEVMVVAEDGSVARRARPIPADCGESSAAFRALDLQDGRVVLAHQASSDRLLAGSAASYYHQGCGGALVRRQFSLVDPDKPSIPDVASAELSDPAGSAPPSSMTFDTRRVPAAGPLDLAFTPKGSRVAAIALDDRFGSSANLWVAPWDGATFPDLMTLTLAKMITGVKVTGQPVAVAFDGDGKYIVQSREPATLELEDGTSISLSSESHADSGHLMFYMNSSIGLSCSSCHPEGGEDGHVWHFEQGLRRTMSLGGGVMQRAPFHWDGSLPDMGALVNEVMITRMAIPARPTDPQVAVLGAFLDQLPALPSAEGLDRAAVARGERAFRRPDVACASCHSGPQYTDSSLADVGTGGTFVVPTLLGVGLRTSLFHDGCAKNVEQRFGACGGTAHGSADLLSDAERADLITFLRSL